MLTLLMFTIGTSTTILLAPKNKIWSTTIAQTSLLFIAGSILLIPTNLSFSNTGWGLSNDLINTPLIVLSLWLIPVSLLASTNHLQSNSSLTNRTFILLSLTILWFLMITFSATNLIVFFLGFEGTLLPTLFLIARWGMQQERIEAGYYFVFYTLISSLPLFLGLLFYYNENSHISIAILTLISSGTTMTTLAIFCIVAFLVKVPIFGLHLWLPKAHVEAPVAGSMILAAILLKMGGYGFIRLTSLFYLPFQKIISTYLTPFCCWGGLLTSLICLTQTDLKSLIAYSSVSHMSFMIAGLSLFSNWAISGSIIVMIAHGLVSSALFCIANVFYERTGTRTLSASRGIKTLYLSLPMFWLIFACANMGLPPLPNAIGELFIFSAIISYSITNFLPTLAGVLFTGIFSLSIYQLLNTGAQANWNSLTNKITEREYNTLLLHLAPLLAIITLPSLMTY